VILDAAKSVQHYDPITQTEDYVEQAQIHAARLSDSLSRSLLGFRRWGNPVGGLLVRRVPVGHVPSTPDHADHATGIRLLAAAAMSVVAAKLGDQYGFRPELGGSIVQDVVPVAGAEKTQWSISSDVRLEDHVEMAFSEYRSDYVGLLCLRPDHERVAGTTLASIDRILPLLDATTQRILSEARYKTEVDESFLVGGGYRRPIWTGPIAVLVGKHERPRLRGDFALTKGLDAEAQSAFACLRDIASTATVTLLLDPGDLLFVDNHRAFHGRTSFRARADGSDRWLLRTFIVKDLGRTEHIRPNDGRIVDTDYSTGPDVLADAISMTS
jgi:L-asparagine oxygenase